MTAVSYIAGFAVALACAAAARRIAIAKGRGGPGNFAAAGFFLGPIGLAWAAFRRPEVDGEGRLAWWGQSSVARTWTGLAVLLFAVAVGIAGYIATRPASFDGNSLEPQIKSWLSAHNAPGATVDCPDTYEGKAGDTFLCIATDNTGTAHVQVTVLNGQGEVNWMVIG